MSLILANVAYYLGLPGCCQTRHKLDRYGWGIGAGGLLLGVVGFTVRSFDNGKNCPLSGDSIFQIHGLFHVLVSWALLAGYMVLRAEIVVVDEEMSPQDGVELDTFQPVGAQEGQDDVEKGQAKVNIDIPDEAGTAERAKSLQAGEAEPLSPQGDR